MEGKRKLIEDLSKEILYSLEDEIRREFEGNRKMSIEFFNQRMDMAKEKAIRDAINVVDKDNIEYWIKVFNK